MLCFRQHSETIRRCDHTMKELEYYRGQHRAAMSQLEAATAESSTLRAKYSEIAAEKLRLERDMQTLQMELGELRSQVRILRTNLLQMNYFVSATGLIGSYG